VVALHNTSCSCFCSCCACCMHARSHMCGCIPNGIYPVRCAVHCASAPRVADCRCHRQALHNTLHNACCVEPAPAAGVHSCLPARHDTARTLTCRCLAASCSAGRLSMALHVSTVCTASVCWRCADDGHPCRSAVQAFTGYDRLPTIVIIHSRQVLMVQQDLLLL
jgi:hypothetical protein